MFWNRPPKTPGTPAAAEDAASKEPLPASAEGVLLALRDVLDPDLGIDIVSLGMVGVQDVSDVAARVTLTPTAPLCPYTDFLVGMIRGTVKSRIPSVTDVDVEVVHEPPWTPSRMSPEARRTLGWDE